MQGFSPCYEKIGENGENGNYKIFPEFINTFQKAAAARIVPFSPTLCPSISP
jgi:hypothetical protein